MIKDDAEALVLASGSAIRRQLLSAVGLAFTVDPASLDEMQLMASGAREGMTSEAMSQLLAELKARRVASRHPGTLIIGADQILDFDGRWLNKVETAEEARQRLWELRGRTHELVSSIVVVKDEQRVWHVTNRARLTVRQFDDDFLESYLSHAGSALTDSVGCYALEGYGLHLFSEIEGDYFTILGLPLLSLLSFLRQRGVLLT